MSEGGLTVYGDTAAERGEPALTCMEPDRTRAVIASSFSSTVKSLGRVDFLQNSSVFCRALLLVGHWAVPLAMQAATRAAVADFWCVLLVPHL